jgi:quercetin dioxygenase-like cupin family protein
MLDPQNSPPRRVVTGHDHKGRSVVLSDGTSPRSHSLPDAEFHEIWSTSATPAPIAPGEGVDPVTGHIRTPPEPGGTRVRFVDFAANAVSPMHRTETVDYGVVVSGRMALLLDDGSETLLEAGDIVVQRGTDHAWANRSDGVSRMLFVLIDGAFDDELRTRLPERALEQLYDHALDE